MSGRDEGEEGPLRRARRKLIETKQRWAREGRLLSDRPAEAPRRRLPPGQRQVTQWPVLDLGVQPALPVEEWSLTVDGLVETPLVWDWEAFLAQPQVRHVSDIHCVTAWSRYDNRWNGVPSAHLLAQTRPLEAAGFVILHSHDGYATNLPLARFAAANVLLAHAWNGAPLTRAHGGPVRAVVPDLYFWKSAKWLRRIEFSAEDRPGFWEVRGYHGEGDPWREERYG